MGRKILLLLVIFIAAFVFGTPVSAASVPNFPSCGTPSGSILADHPEGDHGVPGDTGAYSGSDTVYSQGNGNALQCLCANGAGIQTTWWNVSGLSTAEIQTYIQAGWVYIPNGSDWGLANAPYLALNSNYSCNGTGGDNGGGQVGGANISCNAAKPPAPVLTSVVRTGSTAHLNWSAVTPVTHYAIVYGTTPGNYIYGVANVGNVTEFTVGSLDPAQTYYFAVRAVNDCTPSELSGSGGQVLGAATGIGGAVLGLAATGTTSLLVALLVAGIALTAAGVYLRRNEI